MRISFRLNILAYVLVALMSATASPTGHSQTTKNGRDHGEDFFPFIIGEPTPVDAKRRADGGAIEDLEPFTIGEPTPVDQGNEE
ncbi:hypothetical protein C8J57DRAFT_1343576 [Mycena rebaudengoi]|nr:hypothetical protein C8J57DRAFT_1343576 [Mycena rebaudengoi]